MAEPLNNPQSLNVDVSALVTALQLGNQQSAAIVNQLRLRFADQSANKSRLAISYSSAGGTLVSSAPCYLTAISITTASTGTTALCYDCDAVANAGSTNAFVVVPSSGILVTDWPCLSGLVVQASSQGTHTVAVSYI